MTYNINTHAIYCEQNNIIIDFDYYISICKSIYKNKNEKYGNTFLLTSNSTFVDIILSKVLRCRNILIKTEDDILVKDENIQDTLYSIINYNVILYKSIKDNGLPVLFYFDNIQKILKELQQNKNNDYSNAIFQYKNLSIIEIIGAKMLRIKNTNIYNEKTLDDILDVINYSIYLLNRF